MKRTRWAVMAVLSALVLWGGVMATAQETETELAVSKNILAERAQMEQSLDVPKIVEEMSVPDPVREKVVARARQLMETELLAMADDITRHPEIGFEEHRTVKILTDYLSAHGFRVTMPVAGLATAFTARWDSPANRDLKPGEHAPVMGVLLEYDALKGAKGPFHGDQHSAQGPIAIAVALAMQEYLRDSHTPGTIIGYGTPAEEMMPVVKTIMYKAHVFDGLDVMVRTHSSPITSRAAPGFGTCCLNIDGVHYIFSGAPSHQMVPWNGRNALEAAVHFYTGVDALRSTIRPEARIQGVITEGGTVPNVVPDRAVVHYYIRYPDDVYLQQVRGMIDDAARAAALATGTKVKIQEDGVDRDGISVATLNEVSFAYAKQYGGTNIQPIGAPNGWDESGSVSSQIPGIEVQVQTSNAPYHTYGMLADATTEVGHRGFVIDAEVMTALLYDYATKPAYRAAISKEFKAIQGEFAAYEKALATAYPVPTVPDPQ